MFASQFWESLTLANITENYLEHLLHPLCTALRLLYLLAFLFLLCFTIQSCKTVTLNIYMNLFFMVVTEPLVKVYVSCHALPSCFNLQCVNNECKVKLKISTTYCTV